MLEGSVRRAGDRVRITAQLIDGTDGSHVWAEQYDVENAEVLTFQDEITDQIAGRLGIKLERVSVARTRSKRPESMAAYELVWRARRLIQELHSAEGHAQARSLLERAVELDPELGTAYSELAWIYLDEYRFGFDPRPNPLDRALSAAKRGVELAPDNGFINWRLAKVHFFRKEMARFAAATEKAIALNPNHAEMVADIGIHLCWTGSLEPCHELIMRAMRLDPHYPPWLHFATFYYYYLTGNYEQALAESLKIDMPDFYWTHVARATAYGKLGQLEKARLAAAETRRLKPGVSVVEDHRTFNFPEDNIKKLAEGFQAAGLE